MSRKALKLLRKHPGLLLNTMNPGTWTTNKERVSFQFESDGIELGAMNLTCARNRLEEGIQEVYEKNMRRVVAKIRKASFV